MEYPTFAVLHKPTTPNCQPILAGIMDPISYHGYRDGGLHIHITPDMQSAMTQDVRTNGRLRPNQDTSGDGSPDVHTVSPCMSTSSLE